MTHEPATSTTSYLNRDELTRQAASLQHGGLLAWWRRWQRGRAAERRRETAAFALYDGIVKAARDPALYRDLQVPDTNDGRFEVIVLHAALVLRRLRPISLEGQALAQALFDTIVNDFDRSIREMGVGDLSVGKWVKRMTQSFMARCEAVDRAFDRDDEGALRDVLARNVWLDTDPASARAAALAARLHAWNDRLAALSDDALLRGHVAPAGGDPARS